MNPNRYLQSWLGRLPTWIWVPVAYFGTHLPSLVLLPVFADEAIYIRWAQLIQDDAIRYAFFSMADGKPPLFMWVLSLTLRLFPDPLYAGRFTAVLVGLGTVYMLRALVMELTQDKVAKNIATVVSIFLPFWFFYHRMALMDGLLSLFLGLAFLFALRLSKLVMEGEKKKGKWFLHCLFLSLSFGGAMMTKTPALFTIPIIALTPFFVWIQSGKREVGKLATSVFVVGLSGFVGVLFFVTLRVSPLFGALFSRSTDFTFTLANLFSGEWKYVLWKSLPRNIEWIISYATPELFVVSLLGLGFKRSRMRVGFLLVCTLLFLSPLTLVGKVLWPRYFLPSMIFLTLAMALGAAEAIKHKSIGYLCKVLMVFALLRCVLFMATSFFSVSSIPFVQDDRVQYLEEWSAGFGNVQVRDFIVQQQKQLPSDESKKIIVLTEGSFGTLPDGLLMYFHNRNTHGLEIHGIGVSIPQIPSEYLARAKTNDVYYMVNSHRFKITDLRTLKKVFEVQRPGGPSLLFYKVVVN